MTIRTTTTMSAIIAPLIPLFCGGPGGMGAIGGP
jgi:hypothetical protein